jgi:hypothetical protein
MIKDDVTETAIVQPHRWPFSTLNPFGFVNKGSPNALVFDIHRCRDRCDRDLCRVCYCLSEWFGRGGGELHHAAFAFDFVTSSARISTFRPWPIITGLSSTSLMSAHSSRSASQVLAHRSRPQRPGRRTRQGAASAVEPAKAQIAQTAFRRQPIAVSLVRVLKPTDNIIRLSDLPSPHGRAFARLLTCGADRFAGAVQGKRRQSEATMAFARAGRAGTSACLIGCHGVSRYFGVLRPSYCRPLQRASRSTQSPSILSSMR